MFNGSASSSRICALAIGAHPDDPVLSIGGLLAQLSETGHQVIVLALSSGELTGNPSTRETEEEEAVRRLGASVAFARLPDGRVTVRDAIAAIDDVVHEYNPAIALVHSANDTHQDHVAAFEAAIVSCRKVPTLLTYESPSSFGFEPTVTLDVTNVWERKVHALEAYESQVNSRDLLFWVTATANYRAWPRHVGALCEGLRLRHSGFLPAAHVPPSRAAAAGTGRVC
ncbi:MAG: PIG-L deacetylase family protein [Gammaproteobacteria bacterium]